MTVAALQGLASPRSSARRRLPPLNGEPGPAAAGTEPGPAAGTEPGPAAGTEPGPAAGPILGNVSLVVHLPEDLAARVEAAWHDATGRSAPS